MVDSRGIGGGARLAHLVGAGRVDAVLVGDDLPELGTDLVTALAALDVYELTHVCAVLRVREERTNLD